MIALARRGLLDRRRALLAWALAVGLGGAFFMLVWPSVEDAFGEAIGNYPESLKQAFGITSLSTAEEYLNAELFSLILPFALAVLAIRAISAGVVGAQERGYLDVLLCAPISRSRVVAATAAAVAVEVAAVLAAGWALTWLGSAIAGADLSLGLAAAGYASVWPLAMFAAGMAMLAAGLLQRSASVTGIASGVLVAMYVVDLLGKLSDSLEPLRWVSVFKYYGAAAVDGLDPLAFAGVTAAALALIAAGALLFERRDLAA